MNAFKALQAAPLGINFDDYEKEAIVPLGDAVFRDEEDTLCISLEYGHTAAAVGDYYGEFRGGYPWISPKLEELAERLGLEIEWRDPGTLSLYPL